MMALVLALIFIALIYRHNTWRTVPWPKNGVRPPQYQGHRGYWKGGAQENTMASFVAARQRGLQMVEMDVCLSKDLVPVIFHDVDLKRLAGREQNVDACSVEDLRQWANVSTLEEVLVSPSIPSYLNIELKTSSVLSGILEKQVAHLIQVHGAQKRVIFSSFNPFSLWRLSRYLPEVPRALLASEEKESGNWLYLRRLWLAPYVKVHALHLDHNYVDVSRLQYWNKRGIPVALWTVNDPEKAVAYLKAGALSIISDTLGSSEAHLFSGENK